MVSQFEPEAPFLFGTCRLPLRSLDMENHANAGAGYYASPEVHPSRPSSVRLLGEGQPVAYPLAHFRREIGAAQRPPHSLARALVHLLCTCHQAARGLRISVLPTPESGQHSPPSSAVAPAPGRGLTHLLSACSQVEGPMPNPMLLAGAGGST